MTDRRTRLAEALRELAPGLPSHEFGVVLDSALSSIGLRTATPQEAAWLSLVSYARHVFTDYDDLLEEGYDVESARFFVRDDINAVLERWSARRRVGEED